MNLFTRMICSFCLVIAALSQGYGQQVRAGIKVIARVKKDSVILRWGPTTALAWEMSNKAGYVVKRYTVVKDETLDPSANSSGITLTASPIKPLPLDKWEPIAKGDKYGAIAAQALYGKSFTMSNPSTNTMAFVNQSEERESRWSFALFSADQSIPVAVGMGLRLIDATIKKNEKYLYRVFPAVQNKIYPIDSGAVFVDPAEILELPPPEDVKAEFGDMSVALSWNTLYFQSIYSSYKVERSDDEGKTFKPVDNLPFTSTRPSDGKESQRAYYLDSLTQNYKVYEYRVRGITPFGETGPPSAAVKGTGLGSANGVVPLIYFANAFNEGGAIVQWKYPKENLDRINGFTVGRASSAQGPFINITPVMLGTDKDYFVDKESKSINYYVVHAIAKDGKTSTSFPYMVQPDDDVPPAAPTNITGKISPRGEVSLQWTNNSEADLAGYRVFRANSPTEEFVQITREAIKTSTFKDSISLQTLTKKIYYKIVATDNRFNLSAYSKTLTLARPDIIPPSASLFSKGESKDGTILLEWLPSVSDDVASYQLSRSDRSDTSKIFLKELRNDSTQFIDRKVERGNQYRYRLIVKDSAGLISTPTFISVNSIDEGVRPAIKDILSKVDREGRKIILQWAYPTGGLRGFQVFRSSGNTPTRLYKFLDPDKTQFIDKELRINVTYTYTLKAIFQNGAESDMSEGVVISY